MLTSKDCDIGDAQAVAAMISRQQPDLIINAAAYTAVDKAESEAIQCERVNAIGPANLATYSGSARLFHVSTDFVFDGNQGGPWKPNQDTHPLSVYGRTKLEGEAPVVGLGARGLILRTSWVYSKFGNNFVKTMLKLMATRPELRVVADQVGAPTWARGLASALWRAAELPAFHGLHHWRDAGAASWYDFAVAISEEGAARSLLPGVTPVLPIETRDYPTPAKRPANSLLDCTDTWKLLGIAPPHWRHNLRFMLDELKEDHG